MFMYLLAASAAAAPNKKVAICFELTLIFVFLKI
jgi:hypothetical protein